MYITYTWNIIYNGRYRVPDSISEYIYMYTLDRIPEYLSDTILDRFPAYM